jgi:uncharacterized damage-inducible protein DinB
MHDGAMTWTAPAPPPLDDGPLVGPEPAVLAAVLAWQRRTLLDICAGLTADQLAERAVRPSTLSLLGLVRHMAKVERTWFCERVAGQRLEPLYDPAAGADADFDGAQATGAEEDFARLVEQFQQADLAVAGRRLEETFVLRGQDHSLRLVYVHMIAEYARHNGHADLLRQRIDGTTGR